MLGTEITLAGQSDTHTQLSGHGMLQGSMVMGMAGRTSVQFMVRGQLEAW